MSKNEINSMFEKTDNSELKGIMSIMLMTGNRISENLLLKGKDISTDNEHIYINCYILKKRDGIHRFTKKIKKSHEYYKYFQEYINNENIKEETFIFKSGRKVIWKKIKNINPNATPHLFRHTVATLLGQFMDAFTLQKWFGWTKLEMAAKYVHPKNVIQAGTDALDKAF